MDPQAIRKEASLGHTVFSPWPKKMLNEAADEIERLREALTEIERLYYTEAKTHLGGRRICGLSLRAPSPTNRRSKP
jgi:hypothetical protein